MPAPCPFLFEAASLPLSPSLVNLPPHLPSTPGCCRNPTGNSTRHRIRQPDNLPPTSHPLPSPFVPAGFLPRSDRALFSPIPSHVPSLHPPSRHKRKCSRASPSPICARVPLLASQCIVMKDRETGRSRGFGFVVRLLSPASSYPCAPRFSLWFLSFASRPCPECLPRETKGIGSRSDLPLTNFLSLSFLARFS